MGHPASSALIELSQRISGSVDLSDPRTLSMLRSICDGIAALWGSGCEVVLHDFSDLDHSVVYVAGNVTGRAIGAPLTDLGLQVLTSGSSDQGVLVYHAKAPDGRLMKSASVLFRDSSTGRPFGALCINLDIEWLQRAREIFNNLLAVPVEHAVEERYPNDPREMIQMMVEDLLTERGWIVADLTRDQRLEVIRHLERGGAFAYRSAPSIIAELLTVSRYTIYNYLKLLRQDPAA